MKTSLLSRKKAQNENKHGFLGNAVEVKTTETCKLADCCKNKSGTKN